MMYDTACQQGPCLPIPTQEHLLAAVTQSSQALLPVRKGPGRPASLSNMHLCLLIVLSGLRGFGAQLALWRLLCMEPIGPFAPVQVVDQAVYNRLERAAGLMQALFVQVSAWMRQQLDGLQDRTLAPFASQVLALEISPLDVVGRWLPELRGKLSGDSALLAGRISALFDVRLHQWVRVDLLEEATGNCKQHAELR